MSWSEGEQTLENFLEEDLPFLIKSQYEATLVVLKKKLELLNLSLDLIVSQYPNFLEKIKYHLFFFFAHQISIICSNTNNNYDFYDQYCSVALLYKNQYIYSFVDKQIQEQTVQQIINSIQTKV